VVAVRPLTHVVAATPLTHEVAAGPDHSIYVVAADIRGGSKATKAFDASEARPLTRPLPGRAAAAQKWELPYTPARWCSLHRNGSCLILYFQT